jgi:phosphoribosylaminoimidazole-succinocarboxamide synthase
MEEILKDTKFDWLGEKKTGKVRDIYVQDDKVILIATDRHSSFDRIIAHIPRKGEILNRITAWWMDNTKDIVPNHFLAMPDPNVTIARRCVPLPIEAVVRGYLTGVTDTSIWTQYKAAKRDFGNFTLPDGMHKNARLPKPVFTPSTKADDHDVTMSPQDMVARGIISQELIAKVEKISLALFARGQDIALKSGLILADTKYEFGLHKTDLNNSQNYDIMLIDEIHTPDSSRWWYADSYEDRFTKGEEPVYFDKEFLRLWFKDHCDPYKDSVLPEAPVALIEEMTRRYKKIYHDITKNEILPLSESIEQRIAKNLHGFVR